MCFQDLFYIHVPPPSTDNRESSGGFFAKIETFRFILSCVCLFVVSCRAERVEPVGVTMAAKELGTQLIELSSTDKDFIAVSEEVYIVASCDCHVTCHIDHTDAEYDMPSP